MRIYVETNFLLELVLSQEQSQACVDIMTLCVSGQSQLVVPAFSIPEAQHALIGKHKIRKDLLENLSGHRTQIARSSLHNELAGAIGSVVNRLQLGTQNEESAFQKIVDHILSIAELIPLDQDILALAMTLPRDESVFDPIVLASVLKHLERHPMVGNSCFLTRDQGYFSDSDIKKMIEEQNCKPFFSFDKGCDFISRRRA